MLALVPALHFRQLLVEAVGNYADPAARVGDLVYLHADFGILAHPFDFLPVRLEHIDIVRFIGEMHRDDVGLITERTAQPSDRGALQDLTTLLLGHLVDYHGRNPTFLSADLSCWDAKPEG